MSCYLPIVNSNCANNNDSSQKHVQVTLKRIILKFLCLHHSKRNNPITNDQLNLLINFKPTKGKELEKPQKEKMPSTRN